MRLGEKKGLKEAENAMKRAAEARKRPLDVNIPIDKGKKRSRRR